jgi:putative membrane protein
MMKQVMLAGAVLMGLAAAPATAADEAWVMKVAQGGMAEVELGKLAAEKGSTDAVKKFGQRMADDHSKANDELKALASQKKIALPSELGADDKALRDRLVKLSGPAFDRAYMTAMVSDHVKDVNEFKLEAHRGTDPDVKAWAAKTLPTLEDHLRMARETNRMPAPTTKK